MHNAEMSSALPLAATMDLQYRLPPFQQIFFTPTIIVSVILLIIAILVMIYLSQRAKAKAKIESRVEALKMAEKILLKRGGDMDDVNRLLYIFKSHPHLDPSAMVMVRDRFHDELRPIIDQMYDHKFGERMEKIFFPPPKDTRRAFADQDKDLKTLVEDKKATAASQAAAAILDLMDATLKPGVVTRLTFEGLEGGHECLIMGHDMQTINVTLPANNNQLVASLKPGMGVEGSLESGPSLMGFSCSVIQAVAGSMPYCRLTAWQSAWEVRKRDSVRLPISLEIDFQHISTSSAAAIRISNLDKEIGTIRPGRLVDLSLGGCGIETPSSSVFRIGDMIRFSKSLVSGNPPATLLGAVVNVDSIDPEIHEGSTQRLHVQFLVIDDVSQRILVRTLRQLQDSAEREEWLQAQQLLQRMRRNKLPSIGSPSGPSRRDSTRIVNGGRKGTTRSAGGRVAGRPTTRSMPTVPQRPSTRSMPKVPPRPTTRSAPKVPPAPPTVRRPPSPGLPQTPPAPER